MLSETRTITAAERIRWALSEVSGFVDIMKKTVGFCVDENGLRMILDGLLGVFGNAKKTVILQLSEKEVFTAWKGISKKCRPGFSVIPETDTTVLLYQDGKAVDLSPYTTGAIYPFASTPHKKPPFWKPRAAVAAEIVCVQNYRLLCVRWGTQNPFTVCNDTTQQICKGTARGQLYLDVTDAKLLYENLLCHGTKTKEELQEYLRDIFTNNTKLQLFRILKKLDSEVFDLGKQLELSEEFYQATKDVFKAYGIQMNELSKHSILLHSALTPLESASANDNAAAVL